MKFIKRSVFTSNYFASTLATKRKIPHNWWFKNLEGFNSIVFQQIKTSKRCLDIEKIYKNNISIFS